jgi:hypothetical protein
MRREKIQLGDCSPTFVVCGSDALRFEHCPTGQVFVEEECRPAVEQPTCFDVSSNQLNHATERLVQATDFCRINSPQGFIHISTASNECSRQALICAGQAGLTIACPRGFTLQRNQLTCVPAPNFCHFVEKGLVQPVKSQLERIYCEHHVEVPGVNNNGMTIANSAMRCKDW